METNIIENLQMVTAPTPFRWVFPLAVTLAVLLPAGLAVWFLHRKKKLPFQEKPPVPPDTLALAALAEILAWLDAAHCREFVIEASQILRHYIEARFGLAAPQLSTEEFLVVAGHSDLLSEEDRTGLADFLHQCDRVKFALAGLETPAMKQLHESAVDFVQTTGSSPTPENSPS